MGKFDPMEPTGVQETGTFISAGCGWYCLQPYKKSAGQRVQLRRNTCRCVVYSAPPALPIWSAAAISSLTRALVCSAPFGTPSAPCLRLFSVLNRETSFLFQPLEARIGSFFSKDWTPNVSMLPPSAISHHPHITASCHYNAPKQLCWAWLLPVSN